MITYRSFDFEKESFEELFDLYAATYGDYGPYKKRWLWEFEKHPHQANYRIFVAEEDEEIVGATTRLPVMLHTKDNEIEASFNTNSMVRKKCRGKGVIQQLYKKSAEVIPVLLSKATAPKMYQVLKKMGYQDIEPNTFLKSIINPWGWILWRTGIKRPKAAFLPFTMSPNVEFIEVDNIGEEFEPFFSNIKGQYDIVVSKTKTYMQWRYCSNPYKKYKIFYKFKDAQLVGIIILSAFGSHVKIVDLLWDAAHFDLLEKSMQRLRKYLRKCGFLKILFWTTDVKLRSILVQKWFSDSGETPHFSFYSSHMPDFCFSGKRIGFFEGDGDSEYLGS